MQPSNNLYTADYSYVYFTNLHDQASLLPKEIETLTCNKSWPEHCISRYKIAAVSGRGYSLHMITLDIIPPGDTPVYTLVHCPHYNSDIL